MTGSAGTPGPTTATARQAVGGFLRRWRALLVLLLVFAVGVLVIGPRGTPGPPYDPTSTSPRGARGLVLLLEEVGLDVRISADPPGAGVDTALVLVDDLPDAQRAELRRFAEEGGRLVVADPTSPLTPPVVGFTAVAFTDPSLTPDCDSPLVAGIGRITAPGSVVYDPAGGVGCFPRNDGAWLVRTPTGDGEVIALGGPGPFTNELLGEVDNAVLVGNVLAADVDTVVQVLRPRVVGGDASLADLVPTSAWTGLASIVLAWLAAMWWRGRRLGRPVDEPQPVELDAAETTVAVGNLLQRAGARGSAAAVLRADLARTLDEQAGTGRHTPDGEELVAVAAARLGEDPARLHHALAGPPPTRDAELLALARDVEALRRAARRPPGTTPSPPHEPAPPEPARTA